jgi:hypothetical protein
MSGKLSNTVRLEFVGQALAYVKKSGSFEELVTDRMRALLKSAQDTARDIEIEKAKHYAGTRPQDRRKQFIKMADTIEGIANELEVFTAPLSRYREERDTPPTRPAGLTELRQALGNQLNGVLSAEFIGRSGFVPFQFDPCNVSLGPINTRNRFEALNGGGEVIFIDLLQQMAASLRAAERLIVANTRNGPRNWPIRHRVLVNLAALWQEIHEDTGELSYGGGQSAFFKFCQNLCQAMDAGSLCTATHLLAAVEYYNNEIVEKPTLETTQDSPITLK